MPIPRISLVPADIKCGVNGDIENPLLGGTGDTVFVTYILEYTGDTKFNGLHCNHYCKIIGGATSGDVSIKFNDNDFKYLQTIFGSTSGYCANKFEILIQKVDTGTQPNPTMWKIIDFTSEIPNHTVGNLIDPVNLRGSRYIITASDYEYSSITYDLTQYLSSTFEFGYEQPFPASIKLVRATDLEVMNFLINLPSGYFETTQNPSYPISGPFPSKRITEVSLLDNDKDTVAIAKTTSPIVRSAFQV